MKSLPIDNYLDSIKQLVRSHSQVILTATPGAGKTTRLPYHLLETVKGKIAVLQTRRLAAISACKFIAKEKQWTEGCEVGYQVRLDNCYDQNTRLLFMTDAILLRRLIDDPELKDFDLIVIDEFHERNLNQDLVLGIIKELQDMGSPIKLLVMSATLDTTELKRFLPQSQWIDVPGKVYPLEILYSSQTLKVSVDNDFIKKVTSAIFEADQKTPNDILVFLPGVGEINKVKESLEERSLKRDIQILHGSLSISLQQNVLSKSQIKRVILSTNIAEASVTVPNVDYVIDSGLARILTTNLNSGFSRLEISNIAKFNADQRAGRAAREKEGLCYRLWTPFDQQSFDMQIAPEVQRADLTSILLLLSFLGVRDFGAFSWLSAPSKSLISSAEFYLQSIKALEKDNTLTDFGKRLLKYPTEPRWGAILNEAEHFGGTDLATSIVALLQAQESKEIDSSYDHEESDVLSFFDNLQKYIKGKQSFRKYGLEKIIETKIQLQKNIIQKKSSRDNHSLLDEFLLKTQIDRICRRRQKSDRALMVGGRGVRLAESSQVKNSEFLVALHGRDFKNNPETLITMAHGFDKSTLLEILKDNISVKEHVVYDDIKDQFYLKKVRCLYDLEIEDSVLKPISESDIGDRLLEVLVQRWDFIVSNNKKLNSWIARWKFYSKNKKDSILDRKNIEKVLEMASVGQKRIADIISQDLVYFLETTISHEVLNEFHKLVPETFKAPSEKQYPIHYLETEDPFVEIRLQELFGLTKNPVIGMEQKPLVFKLLAPSQRPIQVTSDIEGFWKGSYFDVRKDLKGRYPKHAWPEDPINTKPKMKSSFKK